MSDKSIEEQLREILIALRDIDGFELNEENWSAGSIIGGANKLSEILMRAKGRAKSEAIGYTSTAGPPPESVSYGSDKPKALPGLLQAGSIDLRDRIALEAMRSFLANKATGHDVIAEAAYSLADAMLKERDGEKRTLNLDESTRHSLVELAKKRGVTEIDVMNEILCDWATED